MGNLISYLELMVSKNASDFFFSTGALPTIKIEGLCHPVGQVAFAPNQVKELAYSILNDDQKRTFEKTMELNLALGFDAIGRFRFNFYRQRGEVSMVVRYIHSTIPSLESLNLPPVLKELVGLNRGLILVVGSAGSGKSTTLASMIDYRNQHTPGHILCIEDPIEFLHTHKRSVVDQREVGLDTMSFISALSNAMREAPDVIMIGEIRDQQTMQHAIAYAETGHLCLATLHANNADQALNRVVNFFPDTAHKQLFMDLSLNLKAVVAMRLVAGVSELRIPAVEVLLQSPYISELIETGEIDLIKDTMEKSQNMGMATFDHALFSLYKQGLITREVALKNADSENNMMVKMRLAGEVSDTKFNMGDGEV
ncbi:PilT/PilU family type 4a pilus ATPase [Zhongshania arctica]|uniref:PilT/PilU family type 4a pilus ATPase n=1 Tax=Zhongshania arctica TaxID=3238302 RepID=A0ABV3U0F2_9GAMM